MKSPITPILTFAAVSFLPSLRAEHDVSFEKELFISAPEVVDSAEARPGGPWHIKSALERIAGKGADVDQYAAAWFKTWTVNETLPGVNDAFSQRPWVTTALQDAWNNDRIKLIAIVNRVDLARFPDGNTAKPPLTLGEGRFVYELRDSAGTRLPFTIIFEYGVPFDRASDSGAALKAWAKRWHALGRPDPAFGSEAYRKELAVLTNEFSAHGTLNQIRTNEFLQPTTPPRLWQLREFHHQERPAALLQVPVAITPAIGFRETAGGANAQLRNFLDGKKADLLAGKHDSLLREFQGAHSPVDAPTFKWKVDAGGDAILERARFIFSFNTCSGCHGGDAGTAAPGNTAAGPMLFQHIGVNTGAGLSPFLSGPITLEKPLPPTNNASVTHNEKQIRIDILKGLSADSVAQDVQENLTKLIQGRANRVH